MDSQFGLLQSARVLRLVLSPSANSLAWEGFTSPLEEVFGETIPRTLEDFISGLSEDARSRFVEMRKHGAHSTVAIEFLKPSSWELLCHRDPNNQEIFYFYCSNTVHPTAQSYKTVTSLNERLKLGMSEAHHRVKNTLQNVVSYINVISAQKQQLSSDDVQKIVRYIHSLSSIHEILLEEVRSNGDGKTVRLDRVIGDVLEINAHTKQVEWIDLPELIATPRKTATVSLILNELLDYASKIGDGIIQVKVLKNEQELLGTLEVSNTISPTFQSPHESEPLHGLRIVELLAKADLRSDVKIKNSGSIYDMSVSFSLDAKIGSCNVTSDEGLE